MTRGYGGRFGFRRAGPMEHPLPPPRVSGLRKGVGTFYDYLCFFGLVCGSPPSVRLVIQPRQAPSDVLSYTAAENAVRWRNLAAPHGVGVDNSFPTRPSPVDAVAVSAALLVACRACALSLGADGLTAKPSADGTPVGLVMEGLSPCAASDGFATAAATMATRAVWTRVPRWAGNRLEADQDAAATRMGLEWMNGGRMSSFDEWASAHSYQWEANDGGVHSFPAPARVGSQNDRRAPQAP